MKRFHNNDDHEFDDITEAFLQCWSCFETVASEDISYYLSEQSSYVSQKKLKQLIVLYRFYLNDYLNEPIH